MIHMFHYKIGSMIKRHLIFMISFSFVFLQISMGQNQKSGTITYTPVGVFHSGYTPETGAPRQGILIPEGRAEIEIYPEYRSALQSLDLFEYIIVIYHLDRSGSWRDTARPPKSNNEYTFGLFATRSPNRPNPVGIATVKLEKIENGILFVSGIDAYDGTPVIDIKPFLPSIDAVKSKRNEEAEKELGLKGNDS